ncbi:MAG: hypothetical protein LUM44_00110 [Pyrinomonadaceae bacterium]|nr:hypothetical protein [Pyrinomonadaceae bacterium]
MRKIIILLSLTFLLLNIGCSVNFGTGENDPDMKMGLAIDREKAFEFSNETVEEIIAEKNQELYSKMTGLFRKTYSSDEIPKTLEKLDSHFGKVIETKYKSEEIGYWTFPDGTKKPMRKFIYSAKTDKAEMGKYSLQVSVIVENDELKCASFSMTEFAQRLPENPK